MENNIIKSVLLGVILVFGIGATQAQEKVDTSKFGREFSLGLATSYALDADNLFRQTYDFNLVANAQVFVNKYIGAQVVIPFFVHNQATVSEVEAFLLLRLPVSDSLAIYGGTGVVYKWRDDDKFDYLVLAGAEYRIGKDWGVFIEGNFVVEKIDKSSISDGNGKLLAGIRLVF